MRLHVMSDLHLEFAPFDPPQTDADVIVLAGDIHVGTEGVRWARKHFKKTPVIYVLGNHEYYGQAFPGHAAKLKLLTMGTNIRILEKDEVEIDGVTFLGCTLWTDFRLKGNMKVAGAKAEERMNDYRKIRVSPGHRKLKFTDCAKLHQTSVDWIRERIEGHHDRKTVVVTHHAPSPKSIPERHAGSSIGAAYASDLEPIIEENSATMWIHGHIHDQQDYVVGDTRIIANPRGYPAEPNNDFAENFIVEI